MLTSGHFWVGVVVGGVLVMFVLPMVRGKLGGQSSG